MADAPNPAPRCRAAGFDARSSRLIAFDSAARTKRSTPRSPRSSSTCARAATPRCSSTRHCSTASRRTTSRRWNSAPPSSRPRSPALPARAARGARPPRRRAFAPITSARRLASWSFTEADGTRLGQHITPLDRVGIYVPGGKAAYPSSVLMNALPAHVAGVRRDRHGRADARRRAQSAGARGGAPRRRDARVRDRRRAGDRRARLRDGDDSRRRQDRRSRQRLRRGGQATRVRRRRHRHDRRTRPRSWSSPTPRANPDWVAMDLFAQAEHDELAQAILLSPDAGVARRRRRQHRAASAGACRAATSSPRSLAQPRRARSACATCDEACEIANRIAPEHLELAVADPDALLPTDPQRRARSFSATTARRRSATIAPGPTTCCRPRAARASRRRSGVYDFQKRSSVIAVSRAGAQHAGRIASTLARGEGLSAHARERRISMKSGAWQDRHDRPAIDRYIGLHVPSPKAGPLSYEVACEASRARASTPFVGRGRMSRRTTAYRSPKARRRPTRQFRDRASMLPNGDMTDAPCPRRRVVAHVVRRSPRLSAQVAAQAELIRRDGARRTASRSRAQSLPSVVPERARRFARIGATRRCCSATAPTS